VTSLTVPAYGCELAVPLNHYDDGCPPGKQGPTSVRIQTPTGAYCVDSTEVTREQYQAFLQVAPTVSVTLPAACATQTDFRPHDNTTGEIVQVPPGEEDFPASQVTWCDAYAYCAWAGKRLCGHIGGGAIAEGAPESNPALSQWFHACSKGGATAYPYGDAFDAMACGGGGGVAGSALGPVALRPRCVGGYDGLHDMSGSVWEWNDACDSNDKAGGCHAYGGAYDSTGAQDLACTAVRYWGRMSTAQDIGFRCCTDL
jgi:formylglycine-generating enzyme required for sulfatase activity